MHKNVHKHIRQQSLFRPFQGLYAVKSSKHAACLIRLGLISGSGPAVRRNFLSRSDFLVGVTEWRILLFGEEVYGPPAIYIIVEKIINVIQSEESTNIFSREYVNQKAIVIKFGIGVTATLLHETQYKKKSRTNLSCFVNRLSTNFNWKIHHSQVVHIEILLEFEQNTNILRLYLRNIYPIYYTLRVCLHSVYRPV